MTDDFDGLFCWAVVSVLSLLVWYASPFPTILSCGSCDWFGLVAC